MMQEKKIISKISKPTTKATNLWLFCFTEMSKGHTSIHRASVPADAYSNQL